MRKFKKKFKRPLVRFNTLQIQEGKRVKKLFGLRRSKELWKSEQILREFRQRARQLIAVRDPQNETVLLNRLIKLGMLNEGARLDDVLGLTKESLLERRLQTIVYKKGMAKTPRQARQAIVHGHILITGRKIVFPSYLVNREEEERIVSTFKPPEPMVAPKEAEEEPVVEETPVPDTVQPVEETA